MELSRHAQHDLRKNFTRRQLRKLNAQMTSERMRNMDKWLQKKSD
jgi:hypothetical protein